MDILFGYLQSGFSAVISFVLLLGILIFVHELGHYLIARACGVRVEVFSLGFGKKIFQRKRGDTNYCISIVPLGGYVKMFGEQPGDEIPEDQKPFSFTHKTVWQRMAIVLAGPLMNLFFALAVFIIITLVGEEVKGPQIGDVRTNTAAFASGFRSGDTIIKVGASQITTWDDLQKSLNRYKGQRTLFEVQREKATEAVQFESEIFTKPNPNPLSSAKIIGDIEGLSVYSNAPVLGVRADSPFIVLGLRTGDMIVSVNDQKISYFRELDPILAKLPPDVPVSFEIQRLESKSQKMESFSLQYQPLEKIKNLSSMGLESSQLYLGKVFPSTPAEAAGIKEGDRILSINGEKVEAWDDLLQKVKSFNGQGNFEISYLRGTEQKTVQLKPEMTNQTNAIGLEEKRFTIGISPVILMAAPDTVIVKATGLGDALVRASIRTYDVSVMTVMSFVRLIQNEISPKNIGGIFSIAQAANETFKIGLVAFLQMMGLVSINLFILNLLPVPVLDGGHLVFYIIEAVKGSPLSLKKMELAQMVGMFLLMSLMVFALFNDFSRMFGFH